MFKDSVYIVVGAANGMGRATSDELGEQGATIVASDLGTSVSGEGESAEPVEAAAEAVRAAGGEATAHHGDVSDFNDAADVVRTAVDEYGRVDGATNFAGVLRDDFLFRRDEDNWDAVTSVHLKGHFCLLRHLGAHWHERAANDCLDGDRSFVSVSSRSALGNVGQSNHAAAKAGGLELVRTAARELHRDGVRVNALLPTAYTRMIASVPEEQQPFTCDGMPPERVATTVAYLLSDHAAGVTGCTFWAGGDGIGLVDDPEQTRTAFREGGWTVPELDVVSEIPGQGRDLDERGRRSDA